MIDDRQLKYITSGYSEFEAPHVLVTPPQPPPKRKKGKEKNKIQVK